MGNGSTQCVLYGDEFGLLGASSTFCDDCRKVSSGVGSGVGHLGLLHYIQNTGCQAIWVKLPYFQLL